MEERNSTAEVSIDKFALDVCLEEQPDLFLYWAEEHVGALARRNDIKRRLDEEVKPDIELKVRKDPDTYIVKDAKVTESAVFSAILLQPEYQTLNRELALANDEVNRLAAIREAFDHRRSSLKYLVELWTRDYYGQGAGGSQLGTEKKMERITTEQHRKGIEETVNKRRESRGL